MSVVRGGRQNHGRILNPPYAKEARGVRKRGFSLLLIQVARMIRTHEKRLLRYLSATIPKLTDLRSGYQEEEKLGT
jgi:hypothetical protein